MLIDDDVVINTFYLQECKDCRFWNVILEKWDLLIIVTVYLADALLKQYLEFAHGRVSSALWPSPASSSSS